MKIGFVASIRGREHYDQYYKKTIDHLEARNHAVKHTLHLTHNDVLNMDPDTRDEYFNDFYKELLRCDVVMVDCSYASMNVGYRISYLLNHGKQVIALHVKGSGGELFELLHGNEMDENLYIFEYADYSLTTTVDTALSVVEPHLDQRFTMIFPAHLMAKLDEISLKTKMPKAVYIRGLLENALLEDASN